MRNRKYRKIKLLKDKANSTFQPVITKKFYPRLVNLTNTELTDPEVNLLQKGLKHSLPPINPVQATKELIADLSIKIGSNNSLSGQCSQLIKNHPLQPMDSKTRSILTGLRKKLNHENLILTRADKGSTAVVMKRNDYDSKILQFLEDSNCKVASVDSTFNFSSHVSQVRTIVNKSKSIIKNPDAILVPNPVPLRLYGLVKLHKENIPIRPVVSFISAPTFKLGKFLDRVYKSLIDFRSEYSIRNSIELVNKIANVAPPPDSFLVSFDVRMMFPSIPLPPYH